MLPLPVAVAFSAFFYYVFKYYRWVSSHPLGPFPLPFIGNAIQLRGKPLHEEIPRLAKVYGNVFTIFLPVPMVVFADFEATREALVVKGEDFVGRPPQISEEFEFCDNCGVINSNGDSWRENRRVAITILRDFGMGKGLMEAQVTRSVEEYIQHVKDIKDKSAVNMRWPIQVMVANIINETLFGYRYAYDSCRPLMEYVDAIGELIGEKTQTLARFLVFSFPFFKHVPIISYYGIKSYTRESVHRALETYSPEADPECFVHAYQHKMGSNEHLNHEQMLGVCSDFFAAGMETTTTTLRWTLLFLASNQRVQDKLRSEILSVVGSTRVVSMGDKKCLPYTTACVIEAQRCANVVQINVPRVCTADTEGHKIPKGCFVNADIHAIMAHSSVFEDPLEFRPERFLEEDGKTFKKEVVEQTIPFSVGKRQCAGEGLARVELFLGLAASVQNFQFLPVEGKAIDLEPRPGFILLPKEQCLRVIPVHV